MAGNAINSCHGFIVDTRRAAGRVANLDVHVVCSRPIVCVLFHFNAAMPIQFHHVAYIRLIVDCRGVSESRAGLAIGLRPGLLSSRSVILIFFAACLPWTLRFAILFTAISIVFAFAHGERIRFVQVCEIVLIWRWDLLENDGDIKLFQECKMIFKKYSDAVYFVSFQEFAVEIKRENKKNLLRLYNERRWQRSIRLCLSVIAAMIFNFYYMAFIWIATPWDITWCSLILVPTMAGFCLSAVFLCLCQRTYLRKFWYDQCEKA